MFEEFKQLKKNEWMVIICLFLLSKALVVGAVLLGHYVVDPSMSERKDVVDNDILNLFAQYDSASYLDIVQNGYNSEFMGKGNYNHYPVYPLIVKFFSLVFGIPLAAFLVTNIASFFAILFVYVLIRSDFGITTGKRTLLYLLFFPTIYFFTMMYVEALMLLIVAMMFYFGNKKQWLLMSLLGFVGSATKAFGFALVLPALYMYMKDRGAIENWKINLKKIDYNIMFILAIPFGFAIFLGYLWHITGDPLIHFKLHSAYAANLTFPFYSLFNEARYLLMDLMRGAMQGASYHSFNIVMNVFFVFLAWKSFKIMKPEYSIYVATSGIILFMHETFEGNTRFFLLFFPVFVALAKLTENKRIRRFTTLAYAAFFVLMILFIIRHVNWDIDYYGLIKGYFG